MSEASFKRYEEQERRLREQLEIVIHHLVKGERGDRVIETLYSYFESTSAILGATPYYLERSGLNHANALLLSMVPAITRYMIRQSFGEHPRLPLGQPAAHGKVGTGGDDGVFVVHGICSLIGKIFII